jgi:hypothetical protein
MRIIALNGALGYGFPEESLDRAIEQGVDLIGADCGSSDPGPHYLGSGQYGFTYESLKRDLDVGITRALEHKVPFVMGSAGLAGGQPHLEFIRDIVLEIADERKLSFKMALIHTELDKEYLKDKLRNGKVVPFTDQIELSEEGIDESIRIVGQIGTEPFIEALKEGAEVILAGRACDTAIFAALPILKGYPHGLAFHMAKIIECGAMCAIPSGLDVVSAELQEDGFVLEPGSLDRKCTVDRVAAHTLYEQSSPFYIVEPDGVADLTETEYEQVTDRAVKVTKSKFTPAATKTVKIEGSRLAGYRAVCIAGSNEQLFIDSLEEIIEAIKDHVASNLFGVCTIDDYTLNIRVYGGNKEESENIDIASAKVGLIIDVVGKTEAVSKLVITTARGGIMHYDYAGRKSTAGNLAFPYSPSEFNLGPVYEWSAYHLIEVDEFSEAYQIEYRDIGGKA